MKTINETLKSLENFIRSGNLTPTNKIDGGTFVCAVEETPSGKIYHQNAFETWPPNWQSALKGKERGSVLPCVNGHKLRVVAIFDQWV